ncbi:helix-turn-helix domain-containing protein [Amycolatopsis cihanbeyliensis]|uniref:Helix-turn-helix protein n=1 Tax=Amycolatopsis cihanbeyliensis TaxID=1128664 RepID=A0A542CUI3_AMYCI|nr:helix-turn-helix transcriptional regulator [Amycolatopsis cihanbeyliensis]TQI94473.1 helix-turn-helix protein [Amycolatopsis cihanbeyliensis]
MTGWSDDEDYGPSITRRMLGLTMRQLREHARMSATEACEALEISNATLSRLENGQQGVNVHLAKSMLDVYGEVGRHDEILDLCRKSQRKGWWDTYGVNGRGYITMESDAERVRTFDVLLIPGILQSEEYARTLFQTNEDIRPERVEPLVTVRIIRQERLCGERKPLQVEAIVHEAALRCAVGGTEVMYGQLAHLAELAKLPTVSLRILPNAAGNHDSMSGGFIILTFPKKILPDTLYVEHAFGGSDSEKKQEVDRAKLKFERLRAKALDEAASLAFLERVAEELT